MMTTVVPFRPEAKTRSDQAIQIGLPDVVSFVIALCSGTRKTTDKAVK